MSRILGTDVESGIVSIQFLDELDAETITSGVVDGIAMADASHWNRLCWDCRSATLKLTTLEIYSLPDRVADRMAGMSIHKHRHAIVYSSNSDDYRFLQTMFRNRGYTAAVFTDMESATHWLTASLGDS